MLKGLCNVLKLYNAIVNNNVIIRNIHTQYSRRWHGLYDKASEQSNNTDKINRQEIIDSTSVTVLSGKQSDIHNMHVKISQCTLSQTQQCVYKESG